MFLKKQHILAVTMTSYPLRIGNCHTVARHVLENTLKPDYLFLNLSLTEFPHKEKDLPADLARLSKECSEFKVIWVPGENTKMMKREFPIMRFLSDDDVVMSIDDDMLLDKNHIQTRYQDFLDNKCEFAIKSSDKDYLIGNTMYSKKMIKGWELFWIPEIIHTYHIDQFINNMFWLNGYDSVPASDYWVCPGTKHRMTFFNQINPMAQNNGFLNGRDFCKLFRGIAEKMFQKRWGELRGIMRQPEILNNLKHASCVQGK